MRTRSGGDPHYWLLTTCYLLLATYYLLLITDLLTYYPLPSTYYRSGGDPHHPFFLSPYPHAVWLQPPTLLQHRPVPSHRWVEITHCPVLARPTARTDPHYNPGTAAWKISPFWAYVAPGSGGENVPSLGWQRPFPPLSAGGENVPSLGWQPFPALFCRYVHQCGPHVRRQIV